MLYECPVEAFLHRNCTPSTSCALRLCVSCAALNAHHVSVSAVGLRSLSLSLQTFSVLVVNLPELHEECAGLATLRNSWSVATNVCLRMLAQLKRTPPAGLPHEVKHSLSACPWCVVSTRALICARVYVPTPLLAQSAH